MDWMLNWWTKLSTWMINQTNRLVISWVHNLFSAVQPWSFCVEFACSPRVCVGFLWVILLQQPKDTLTGVRLIRERESRCEWLFVSVCCPCDRLATCPVCIIRWDWPNNNVGWWSQFNSWGQGSVAISCIQNTHKHILCTVHLYKDNNIHMGPLPSTLPPLINHAMGCGLIPD